MEKQVFSWKNRYLVQYIAFFIYFVMCFSNYIITYYGYEALPIKYA